MEEQGLVVVKENFIYKFTKSLRRFFFKGKMKDLLIEGDANNELEDSNVELIQEESEFVQQEIREARRAFRKYVINSDKDISTNVLSYINEKLKENETNIKQIIEINKDDISYEDIVDLLNKEEKVVSKFRAKNKKTGFYNVPIGVIGIECNGAKDSIENIFKSVSTRNSIMILNGNYSKYSTESLVLLIVKECLKNFYIDDNIIQMFEPEEIDLTKLDKLIKLNGEITKKDISNKIYIYQENDEYKEMVMDEVNRLQNEEKYKSYEVKTIKGEFKNIINYLNKNEASAVCMYTKNAQKAYKFINWIDSPNVFVNTGIQGYEKVANTKSNYYNYRNVLHKDVF